MSKDLEIKSNGKKKKREAPLSQVLKLLRAKAISTPEGESIGSEDDLINEFKVSRPTFRSGAAIVSQEQLLYVRRGPGGGYFATRPDPSSVSHIAAIYLQSRRTKLEEVLLAIEPIVIEMVTLAAENRDPDMQADWLSFKEEDLQHGNESQYVAFFEAQQQYGQLLGRACNNKVLELFYGTLSEFVSITTLDSHLFWERADRISSHQDTRSKIVDAILESDSEIAAVLARRSTRTLVSWMVEDLSRNSRTGPFSVEFPFDALVEKGGRLTDQ